MADHKTVRGYLLLASLAVNLFLGGYLAGNFLPRHRPPDNFAGLPSPRHLEDALPGERRDLIKSVIREHSPEVRRAVEAMFEAQKQVAEAMRQEPLEVAALHQALEIYAARQQDMILAHQSAVADLARRLSAEDRARLADILKPPPPPKWKFREDAP